MDTTSVDIMDQGTTTEALLEKIVAGDAVELTCVSLETEGLYHCEKCLQNFPDSNLFSSHPCLVPAPTAPRATPAKMPSDPYQCTLCDATFSLPGALKRHSQSHTAEPSGPAPCPEPGCLVSDSTTPCTTPVKMPAGLYQCALCDETFSLPSALKRHFRSHTAEPAGPAPCSEPGCGFVGADRRELQAHLRAAHSLTLVPCAFRSCRLAFRTAEEMERHRRDHVPFHCALCDFATANAKQLGEHRQRSHPPCTGHEGGKADSEKMEVHSGGAESCANMPCAPGRRKRPRTNTPLTANESQEEEEEEEEEEEKEEEEMGHSSKKAKEEKEWEGTAAATGPEDHHSACHVAEGTEHMFRTHICPECRRCFKKRTHLLEHTRLHFPDPRLQCPHCHRHFTSKSKLRVHLLREAGKKPHRCRLCDYRAVERNALRRHLAGVHGEEEEEEGKEEGEAGRGGRSQDAYPCPACGESFRLSRALKAHMKTHRSTAPDGGPAPLLGCFQEGCGFRASGRRELRRHAADAHGADAVVECRHHACRAVFGSAEAMEEHHRTHLPFHCALCDFSCSNKTLFQRHKRQGHAGDRRLACSFCPFVTFNPVEYEGHVGRLHASEKIHRCPQCGFVTAHKRVLGRHMLLHTGEKPHKCKLCSFRCRDETYLSKHMLTHSDAKNHMCSECGYVTKWKHYLNVHMRKHAGDLRYQCDQCAYRCHRADQLSSHKLRHQEKSLICEVCAFSCKRKYELRKHLQLKHAQGAAGAGPPPPPPPVLQCKYCAYRTPYRQALRSHENSKHTRLREFRCALCSYATFSSTGLFLHKRKAHGYVPGNKAWLEMYAERERENSVAAATASHSCCPPPQPPLWTGGRNGGSSAGGGEQSLASRDVAGRDAVTAEGRAEGVPGEQGSSVAVERESTVAETPASSDLVEGQEEEECCTLVFTPVLSGECAAEDMLHPQSAIVGRGEDSNSARAPGAPESLIPAQEGAEPAANSQRLPDAEEYDISAADCGDQSDEGDEVPPGEAGCREGAGGGVAPIQKPAEEERRGGLLSGHPEAVAEGFPRPEESPLKALKRRDREQAEALVLEGRVQMLVVQTTKGGAVHRCDRCSYVTRRQASLSQHRRSGCVAHRAPMLCEGCGAQFKQSRALDTHQRKKCPAILKKRGRGFPRPTAAGFTEGPTARGFKDGPTSRGVKEGPTTGGFKEGPTAAGGFKDGPTAAGGFKEGPTAAGGFKEGPTAAGGFKEGPTVAGGFKEGPTAAGGFKEGPTAAGGFKEGPTAVGAGEESSCAFGERTTVEYQGETAPEGNQPGCGLHGDETGQPAAVSLPQSGREKERSGCSTEARITSQDESPVRAVPRKKKGRRKLTATDRANSVGPAAPASAKESPTLDRVLGYRKEDDRFKCDKCSFTSCRLTTIERHCTACTAKNLKLKAAGNLSEAAETEDDDSDENYGSEDEGEEEDTGEPAKSAKPAIRFSCDGCPFTCHQQRALDRHRTKGCMKQGDVQCQRCSFVARSEEALERHARVHGGGGGRRPAAAGGRGRSRLRCELCSFTCQQDRCLAQHVALKHEGAKPHACRFCDFTTARRYRLEAHESLHTGEGRHPCPLCPRTYGTTSKLRLHRRRAHERRPTHFCPSCDYSGYGLNDVRRHALSCHATGKPPRSCVLCPAAHFSSDAALKQHALRLHGGEPAGGPTCPACGLACASRSALKAHARREHPTPLECAVCQEQFDTRQALEAHRKTHYTQRCPECPFAARERQALARHLLEEHEGEGGLSPEDRPLCCSACDFRCRHQLVLEQHVRGHGGARLYRCTDCQYSTRNRQKITWHVRVHTGEKPYRCEQCSYACVDPSRLKYHMRIHQDERKYLCPECGYKCKWVNQLKYHMTKHTGAKPYACEECEYRTNRADALRVHRQTRHREARSFVCEECGKAFKTRFLLNTHQRQHSEARPYVCRVCRRAFRWPGGLRHHYLTHTQRHPFHCLHCTYSAKQRFQVVKHLRRHHPEESAEQGVGRDPASRTVTLREARLEPGAEGDEEQREEVPGEDEEGPGAGLEAGQDTAVTNQGEGQ